MGFGKVLKVLFDPIGAVTGGAVSTPDPFKTRKLTGQKTFKESNAERRPPVLTMQQQQQKSSAAQRLAMTQGGVQGQELGQGDFRTKRNIFGN